MDLTHLSLLALLCLALVGSDASQSAEDYWKSVWPNTPLPEALSELLLPYSKTNLPINAEEEKQYWTAFLEHDLHPGKKISLGLNNMHSKNQPFGLRTWGEAKPSPVETHQPFGLRTWGEVKSNPVETHQPFGLRTWGEVKSNPVETHQPFGLRTWGEVKSNPVETHQPFGLRTWGEVKSNPVETHQPFGLRTWGEVKSSPGETHQPNPGKTIEREENTLDDYCGTSAAIGEDKYCASSLEAMMDYAISKLGKNIKVISSSFPQNQEQYVVEEVNKIGDKAVMCHRMNYEKVVFYCHQVNATTSYMVPLVGSDGTKAKALTICHHDTRGMDPVVLYQVLKVKPGTVPVCHFVGNKAVAWVPKQVGSESEDHPCVI